MDQTPRRSRLRPLALLAILSLLGLALGGWYWWKQAGQADPTPGEPTPALPPDSVSSRVPEEAAFVRQRRRMVRQDLHDRGITAERVLQAMGRVPRQRFVPDQLRQHAYEDHPLPIGHGQTISQPYIVALMTQLAEPTPQSRALDIGTGSGYQAAVLGEICAEVYGIEIVEPLANQARQRLASLGYDHVTVRTGDGYGGWPAKAPFDVIIVAAAPDHVPQPLIDQLAPGGKLVIPVGRLFQQLMVVERDRDGEVHYQEKVPVRFVPMTGKATGHTS
jgi:protein-L-isoaspartate(D-aspartate) O-methyltransferase